MGSRLINDALRDLGSGFRSLGNARRASARTEREEGRLADKKKSDELRQKRLADLGIEAAGVSESLTDPELERGQFEANAARLNQLSAELGEPQLANQLLKGGRDVLAQRAQAIRQAESKELGQAKNKQQLKSAKTKAKFARDKFAAKLRKDFQADSSTQTTKSSFSSFNSLKELLNSPVSGPNDMAMVFIFMKGLDRLSVVRESEYKTAANARAFFQRNAKFNEDGTASIEGFSLPLPAFLVTFLQKVDPEQRGAFLTPDQRKSFVDTTRNRLRANLELQKGVDDNFVDIANSAGIDPKLVLGRKGSSELLAEFEKEDADTQAQTTRDASDAALAGEGTKLEEISPENHERIVSDPQIIKEFETILIEENAEREEQGLDKMGKEQIDELEREFLDSKLGVFVNPDKLREFELRQSGGP